MKKRFHFKMLPLWLLSVFFLLLTASETTLRAQSVVRLSLSLEDVELKKAVTVIEGKTNYLFTIGEGVNLSQKVTVKVSDATITEVLDRMTRGTDLSYKISDQVIVLTVKPAPHSRTLTGKVTDQGGEPVIAAGILVKGTTIGTTTDIDGNFTLTVPGEYLGGRLVFSSIGYADEEVPIGRGSVFNVTLRENAVELEGTVVTALGIRRAQKALSYNVQEVKADEVTTVKDANFINSLSGKVAGVTINASSSGVGGASKVVLRGNKSISQSSNALYVIDGVPMYNFGGGGGTEFDSKGATESIADINPEDIESISVLTGAAAAALYGSEAANGAIMITTKKGQAGKVAISFSSNTEFLSPFVLPEFQNRYGTGLNGKSGDQTFSWGAYLPESARYNYSPTDFFQTGTTYTNAFSLSGGTDKNQTYFSAAAVNSDGIIPNNKYDRYNFTFRNTSYFLSDKLRLDLNASYIVQKDQNMTNQGVYANPLTAVYLFPRGNDFSIYQSYERYNPGTKMMEQFWSDALAGDLRMQNPYWIAYRNLRNNSKHRYMMNLTAAYDITSWLNLTGRVKVDNASNIYTQKLYATTEPTISESGSNGHYTEARTEDSQIYADVIASVNKTFGEDWSLNANLGASINNIKTNTMQYGGPIQENGLANVFNVFDLDNIKSRASKSGWNDETQSVFASVEVGWKKMLYFTVTGRNDWASQLAGSSSEKSGFFYPSVGVSWVPTSHWDMGPVTYLKLRGSIAEVGIIQPITLRQTDTDAYQIIAGERRFRAAQIAGLTAIPAYIRTADDENVMQMALIENIQREDLNSMEIALAYQHLLDQYHLTQEQLSERVGKNRATIANYLRLLKLPAEVQMGLKNKQIEMAHARALVSLSDPKLQVNVYREIVDKDYSVRQVEEMVKSLLQGQSVKVGDKKIKPKRVKLPTEYNILKQQLTGFFKAKVQLTCSPKGKGKITIPFNNEEDLERIMTLFDSMK